MWNEPYLETCCRAALHRLVLAGAAGRPAGLPDTRCLDRLVTLGLVSAPEATQNCLYGITPEGLARHRREVLGLAG